MAYFEGKLETTNGTKTVKVPSQQGGSDRTIYLNGSDTGYKLGNNDNKIYKKASGQQVSSLALKDFAKNFL